LLYLRDPANGFRSLPLPLPLPLPLKGSTGLSVKVELPI
jgi:hypothetical protein